MEFLLSANMFNSVCRQWRLISRARLKFKATTDSDHQLPVAPNLLQQEFNADKPHAKWVLDITYIKTA